jgi:AraC family transcriptional regulator
MKPRIEFLTEKKLIGLSSNMSLAQNKTDELWKSFMPRRNEIKNRASPVFISMQVYDPFFDFKNFSPNASFEKWAAVEVMDFNAIPQGMKAYILKEGMHAVFIHKGDASMAEKTFRFIFETWLPQSEYILDNRPHFEILGAKYKNNHPDSEEEVWIPIKKGTNSSYLA